MRHRPGHGGRLPRLGRFPRPAPEAFLADEAAAALRAPGVAGARILWPRADIMDEDLSGRLEAAGATVEQVTAYRTVLAPALDPEARDLLASGGIDLVTFTSSPARSWSEVRRQTNPSG